MRETSELYRTLLADPSHSKEIKLDIEGVTYTQSNIISVSITGGLFSSPGIGNCTSRQADISILPIGEIPRQAKIKPYVRLVKGDQASEWLQKGEFFISTRKRDKVSGVTQITAFDAMLKAEEVWLDETHGTANWPMPQSEAVDDISNKLGVGVDSRTYDRLSTVFPVELPIGEDGEYSMREVLSYIAISCAGNWILTDEGKLLLIKYGDIPPESSLLITSVGEAIAFGEVRLVV